jgi:hypothetical protein
VRFHVEDPAPRTPLADIEPFTLRARSWLARVHRQFHIADGLHLQLVGAIEILGALDYHRDRYMSNLSLLAPYYERLRRQSQFEQLGQPSHTRTTREEFDLLRTLDYEAVAYINRLGQFYYFARSAKVDSLLPRINELVVFRHKHTAHRSIDVPKSESPDDLARQAMAFGFSYSTVNYSPVHKIAHNGNLQVFCMASDHPVVMSDVFHALLALLRPNDA